MPVGVIEPEKLRRLTRRRSTTDVGVIDAVNVRETAFITVPAGVIAAVNRRVIDLTTVPAGVSVPVNDLT